MQVLKDDTAHERKMGLLACLSGLVPGVREIAAALTAMAKDENGAVGFEDVQIRIGNINGSLNAIEAMVK